MKNVHIFQFSFAQHLRGTSLCEVIRYGSFSLKSAFLSYIYF